MLFDNNFWRLLVARYPRAFCDFKIKYFVAEDMEYITLVVDFAWLESYFDKNQIVGSIEIDKRRAKEFYCYITWDRADDYHFHYWYSAFVSSRQEAKIELVNKSFELLEERLKNDL